MDNLSIEQLANMSDEEIAAMSHLSPTAVPQEVPSATNGEVQPNGEAQEDTVPTPNDPSTTEEVVVGDDSVTDDGEPEGGQSPEELKDTSVDYEGFYSALTAPIKAAGREIKIESPEEAIRLIQMGADYSRKNAQHNRDRSTVKALEERGISDPETLGFLADVHAGKPEAIAKLLQKHKVDLFDFDVDAGKDYVPPRAQVAPEVIALESTLDELRATSTTFDTTLTHVNSWDDASRDFVARDPNLLRIIDQEVSNGRFAKVDALVQKGRMLGQFPSTMPYLEAYRACEDVVLKEETAKPAPAKVVAPRPKKVVTAGNDVNRAKVAVPGNASTTAPVVTAETIAAMSDEDILKFKL